MSFHLQFIQIKIKIGVNFRLASGSELVLHPGCLFEIGKNGNCGKHSTISVLSNGNMIIGDNVGIGNNDQIVCHGHIQIGDNSILAPYVMIYDHNHLFDSTTGVHHKEYDIGEVVIGKNVWIGTGSIILKDVHIGNTVIIGAGSVVTKDILDNSIAVGNPAKVIRQLFGNK